MDGPDGKGLAWERATPAQPKTLLWMARQLDREYTTLRKGERRREATIGHAIRHIEFHLALAETSHCQTLTEAIRRSQVLTFQVQIDSSLTSKERPQHWHESLARAIFQGDPMTADAAARAHVRYGLDDSIHRDATGGQPMAHGGAKADEVVLRDGALRK